MRSVEYQRESSVLSMEVGHVYRTNQEDLSKFIHAVDAIGKGVKNNQKILCELRHGNQDVLRLDTQLQLPLARISLDVAHRGGSFETECESNCSYIVDWDCQDKTLSGVELKKIKNMESALVAANHEVGHLRKRLQSFVVCQNHINAKERGAGILERIQSGFLHWRVEVHCDHLKNAFSSLNQVECFLQESGVALKALSELKGLRHVSQNAEAESLYAVKVASVAGSLHFV